MSDVDVVFIDVDYLKREIFFNSLFQLKHVLLPTIDRFCFAHAGKSPRSIVSVNIHLIVLALDFLLGSITLSI